ncbi:MAG: hypothetical protein L6V93_09785 [Clostridiales bacterium]|nr:MAG: hypothetical protein L6V93_09785 [Clostridiales bacterium]
MLEPHTKKWDFDLLKKFGINTDMLCGIIMPGEKLGELSDKVCEELKVKSRRYRGRLARHRVGGCFRSVRQKKISFTSAAERGRFFGTELDEPNITEEGYLSSYTNEGGCGGKIRFLTNIMGLWLIQESRRTYNKRRQGFKLCRP